MLTNVKGPVSCDRVRERAASSSVGGESCDKSANELTQDESRGQCELSGKTYKRALETRTSTVQGRRVRYTPPTYL